MIEYNENGAGYEQNLMGNSQPGSMIPDNNRNGRKKSGRGKKIGKAAAGVCLAAVFGVCTGAGVYGAQKISGLWGNTAIHETASLENTAKDTVQNAVADKNDSGALKVTTTSSKTSDTVIATDVTGVVKNSMPSIVSIDCTFKTKAVNMFGQSMEQESQGSGSGIIVAKSDKELIIVTNNHVISNAETMEVTFNDGAKAKGYLKGTEASVDIGVIAVELEDLKADTLEAISTATLGDSNNLTVGETAIAIGNALGYGQSVTTGVVSALDREIESEDGEKNKFIQTDAAINPGNSGGALLNSKGEVIGVTSSKIGDTKVEGMGFAIPISNVVDLINSLMNESTKITVAEGDKGALGVSVMTPTGVEGAYVSAVKEGSAAEKAGILEGDLITSFDGNSITSSSDLTGMMSYYEKGKTVSVTVLRRIDGEYKSVELQVTLDDAQNVYGSEESDKKDDHEQDEDEESSYGQSDDFSELFPGFGF